MSPFDLSWRNVVIVVVFFFSSELMGKLTLSAEWLSSRMVLHWNLGVGGSAASLQLHGGGGGAEMPPLSTSDATIWAHKGHFSVLCVCPDGGKDTILPIVDKGSWCLVCLPPKATSRQTVPVSRGPFLLLPVFLTLKSQIISLRVGGSS